jgi:hypothetical protein
MDASFTANPRFDPQRNAAEMGLRSIPIFFLGGANNSAGSTDETIDVSNETPPVPWIRIAIVALVLWGIWKLAK